LKEAEMELLFLRFEMATTRRVASFSRSPFARLRADLKLQTRRLKERRGFHLKRQEATSGLKIFAASRPATGLKLPIRFL
jgi:hypothetical protein